MEQNDQTIEAIREQTGVLSAIRDELAQLSLMVQSMLDDAERQREREQQNGRDTLEQTVEQIAESVRQMAEMAVREAHTG